MSTLINKQNNKFAYLNQLSFQITEYIFDELTEMKDGFGKGRIDDKLFLISETGTIIKLPFKVSFYEKNSFVSEIMSVHKYSGNKTLVVLSRIHDMPIEYDTQYFTVSSSYICILLRDNNTITSDVFLTFLSYFPFLWNKLAILKEICFINYKIRIQKRKQIYIIRDLSELN